MKTLRTMISLLLLASVLLAAVPALAADPLTISFLGPVEIEKDKTGEVLKTTVHSTQSGMIVLTLTDQVDKTKPVVYTETKYAYAGQEITWSVPYYDKDMTAEKSIKMLRASFQMDGKKYTYDLYYNFNAKEKTVTVERNSLYYNNTACSFGPAFRDVRPELTEKWYLFTPIDLTIQGRQTFDYVASNMYVIGQVYVDVQGDSVTVTYHNYYEAQSGNTETVNEFFTFFHDLNSVTEVEPENMTDQGYAFGQTVSIEKDLNGDANVLLYIRNRVNYSAYVNTTHKLERFWPNLPERVNLRNQMLILMNRMDSI